MTRQPRRDRLGCVGNTTAAAHLQYILIAGYSAAVAPGTVCSTHVVVPSALAVVQRTGHSRKVSGSNPDTDSLISSFSEIAWSAREGLQFGIKNRLNFRFYPVLFLNSLWPLVLIVSPSGPDFWSSVCLPVVMVFKLHAPGFGPQPACPWFCFSACLPLVLILSLYAPGFGPQPACPWFWFSACLPLVLILCLYAPGFGSQPVCLWCWSSACLPLVLVLSLLAPGFVSQPICLWFWSLACLPLVLVLSLPAPGFGSQPVCLWFWPSACLPLVLVLFFWPRPCFSVLLPRLSCVISIILVLIRGILDLSLDSQVLWL